MPIIRVSKHQHNFLIMDKTGLNDERLSYRARGVLAFLLSKPDTWEVRIDQLVRQSQKDGKAAIMAALNELEAHGYARRERARGEHGKMRGWVTTIREVPDLHTDVRNSDVGTDVRKTDVGKSDIGLLDLKTRIDSSKDKNPDLQAQGQEQLHLGSEVTAVVEVSTPAAPHVAVAEMATPPAKSKKSPKANPTPWPAEDQAFADWLTTQQILTLITPPVDFDWWCDMSYVINGIPTTEWLEREYAKIQMWLREKPQKKPTPRGTSRFVRTWLEKAYNDDRRQRLPHSPPKEVHIHYDSGRRR